MPKAKADPIAKAIWGHMKYAQKFEDAEMVINGEPMIYTPQGELITQKELQAKCEKHMAATVIKIRKIIKESPDA